MRIDALLAGRSGTALSALAGMVLVLACPAVTWFAVGDQSFTGVGPEQLDYMYRAPQTSRAIEGAVCAGLFAVVALALLVLRAALRRVAVHRRTRWMRLLGAFCAAGVFVGLTGRAVTAGGIGANIGAGLMLMAAPWILGFWALGAGQAAWALWRDVPPPAYGPDDWRTRLFKPPPQF